MRISLDRPGVSGPRARPTYRIPASVKRKTPRKDPRGLESHNDRQQQLLPLSTRKNASMSESVPTSPSQLKSAFGGQVAQQFPPRQLKKFSMSRSVPTSPSRLKSSRQHTSAPQELHGTPTLSGKLTPIEPFWRRACQRPAVVGEGARSGSGAYVMAM